MKPLVSVITPYRNAKRFLPAFVDSLQRQTAQDWTCIMVDDGSSDGGPAFLAELVADDPRFQLRINTNPKHWPGPASARNLALAHVKTDYVAFCDVDDLWHPEKLRRQLDFHITNHLELSVSAYARFQNGCLNSAPRRIVCPPETLELADLFGRNPIPMLTVVLDTELTRAGFAQVPHEDFLFWLNLFRARSRLRYGCLPEVLSFYRIHPASVSSRKLVVPFWSYFVFRNAGLTRLRSLIYLLSWFFDHIYERVLVRFRGNHIKASTADLLERPPLLLRPGEWF